ncbi:MAG: ribosome biogenesis GTPase YlqF [Oscillospiraceae bacterium]|nr:ribosome biogenesis GTPase YlqF [Oscillospiraceae bacterium]
MAEEMNIQWFPGHMTKARRMIAENIKLVDAVCEVIDARIPYSSRNPDLDEMTESKPRLIILNRADQADAEATKQWAAHFRSTGAVVLETDSQSGKGVSGFPAAVRTLLRERLAYYESRGQSGRKLRVMVAGIPNVGKSSFINRVSKRKAAPVADKPGVTRGKQWIVIDKGVELLDTPGVLWPRFENQTVAENLAFTGAIRDDILDGETLGANLMTRMRDYYPARITERYKIEVTPEADGFTLLTNAARKRGFLISGGECDLSRMAAVLLDEFRAGKLGRITLERYDDEFELMED